MGLNCVRPESFSCVTNLSISFPGKNIYRNHCRLIIKRATKLYFTHYSCVLIILFNKDLDKSAFLTFTYKKLVFHLSVFFDCSVIQFHLHKLYNIYMIIVYVGISSSVVLLSFFKKQFVKKISCYENLIIALDNSS